MATKYANGAVPASLLAQLDGQPDASLRADAAAAWNRARADVERRTGIVLSVRGWNRTLAEQETFYLQRHKPWKAGQTKCCHWPGRGWFTFTGTAHAAVPGTSNHGLGIAIDVDDYGTVGRFDYPRRTKTFPILAEHGWTDTEGRGAIREPWHLVYDPARDTHPTTPEDDMSAETERQILKDIAYVHETILKRLPAIVADAVVNTKVERRGDPRGGEISLGTYLAWTDANTIANAGRLSALEAIVAKGAGVTAEEIRAAARQGVADAFLDIETTITVKGTPA